MARRAAAPRSTTRSLALGTSLAASVVASRARAETFDTPVGRFTPEAYVEAYWAHNANEPSNGITNARAFDNRHGTVTLTNAAAGGEWAYRGVRGRVLFQIGSTPDTYYGSEPSHRGTPLANASGPGLWKYLQEAYVAYEIPGTGGIGLAAGLFLSPLGPESMAVHGNPFWSRSNLFFGLPFYHTGARLSVPLARDLQATFAVYNGWNSVVDNNPEKSFSGQLVLSRPKVTASLLYFGGIERSRGAPEGSPFRHLVEAYVVVRPSAAVDGFLHVNGGLEPNTFGTHGWVAAQVGARVSVLPWLSVAARQDVFRERPAVGAGGASAPIFWPVEWLASTTATVAVGPSDHLSFRLEARRDQAAAPLYFRGEVQGDGSPERPYVPNATTQTTFTLGVTAWL